MLLALGRTDEAWDVIEDAEALAPGNGDVLAVKGRALRRLGRPSEALTAFDAASRLLDGLDRGRLGLLIDLRAAPGRNDPDFERAMTTRRSELVRGFRAAAILVQTRVGELQIARITREDGSHARVFADEAKALAWLASEKR